MEKYLLTTAPKKPQKLPGLNFTVEIVKLFDSFEKAQIINVNVNYDIEYAINLSTIDTNTADAPIEFETPIKSNVEFTLKQLIVYSIITQKYQNELSSISNKVDIKDLAKNITSDDVTFYTTVQEFKIKNGIAKPATEEKNKLKDYVKWILSKSLTMATNNTTIVGIGMAGMYNVAAQPEVQVGVLLSSIGAVGGYTLNKIPNKKDTMYYYFERVKRERFKIVREVGKSVLFTSPVLLKTGDWKPTAAWITGALLAEMELGYISPRDLYRFRFYANEAREYKSIFYACAIYKKKQNKNAHVFEDDYTMNLYCRLTQGEYMQKYIEFVNKQNANFLNTDNDNNNAKPFVVVDKSVKEKVKITKEIIEML